MLIITLKHRQDFKAFGFADSKLSCKMLFYSFQFFLTFRILGVMKGRENVKAQGRLTDSITILPSFTFGNFQREIRENTK